MKKLLIGAGVLAGIAVLATTFVASAQTATTTAAVANQTQPMILQVNRNGKALLRGTITSVSNGVMTVQSWGGTWTVDVGASATVLPAAVGNDITQFKTGDFVGIEGTVSQSSSLTMDATVVRDWTYKSAVNAEAKQNVQAARNIRNSMRPRDYVGVASNVTGSSFTLSVGGTAYTVDVGSGAEVVNKIWVTMPLSNIQANDNVRVWGVDNNGTITGQIVRDVSVK